MSDEAWLREHGAVVWYDDPHEVGTDADGVAEWSCGQWCVTAPALDGLTIAVWGARRDDAIRRAAIRRARDAIEESINRRESVTEEEMDRATPATA